MFRFRPEVLMLAIGVIAASTSLAVWAHAVYPFVAAAVTVSGLVKAGCVAASAVLVAAVAGMRHELPQYADKTPPSALLRTLIPLVLGVLTAFTLFWVTLAMLKTMPKLHVFAEMALRVTLVLNAGIAVACLMFGTVVVLQYRRARAWECRMGIS